MEADKAQGRSSAADLGRLYALNPAGLPLRGWGLPVRTAVFGDPAQTSRWKQALATFAGQSGWDANPADRPGVAYTLDLQASTAGAGWTLRDAEGKTVKSGILRAPATDTLGAVADLFRQLHWAK